MTHPVAIIGGSAEARKLAALCGPRCAWIGLPEAERVPMRWPVPPEALPETAEALAAILQQSGAAVVVDASHPCDAATPRLVAAAARRAGLPRARLIRPAWRAARGGALCDRWILLRTPAEAARHLAPGSRVLATLGRAGLGQLKALRQHPVFCRRLRAAGVPFPLRMGAFQHGVPPFTETGEVALLRRLRIDALITRNAGGPGGWPKLAAARRLGLPVLMVDRPAQPAGPRHETVAETLRWLEEI